MATSSQTSETERRRRKQTAYNEAHGIVPHTVVKDVRDLLRLGESGEDARDRRSGVRMTEAEKRLEIERLEKQMKEAARMLEFEIAADLRDRIIQLRGKPKNK